jgi:hypothetical protein
MSADEAVMVTGTGNSADDRSIPDLNGVSVNELRALRATLHEQEHRVSYWRRLIQARIDIMETVLQTGSAVPLNSGPDLRRILNSPASRLPESIDAAGAFPVPRQPAWASARPSHARVQAMDAPDGLTGTTTGGRTDGRTDGQWDPARILALWERIVDPADRDGITTVLADLREVEAALSARRAALHAELDDATAALISRYTVDPSQALSALPRIW